MSKRIISEVGLQLVRDTFNLQALAVQVGSQLTRVEYGLVEIKMPSHPLLVQHHGYFHGGIVAYLADISGGLAGFSHFHNPHHSCLTIEFKINFLKAAHGSHILGRGKVIQETGSMFVSHTEVLNEHGECVAVALQTTKKLMNRERK